MHKEKEWEAPPAPDEAAMAQLSYQQWERAEAESMAEYVSRRRTVDLAALTRQAIDEELTPLERTVIRLRYDEGLQPIEIAARLQMHKGNVTHALQRGEERLRQSLKYVVRYQYNLRHTPFLPLAVRRALVVSGVRRAKVCTPGAYLRALRRGENMTLQNAADGVGIVPQRLRAIEQGLPPDADELLRLSTFYGVSADSILKGGTSCRH